MKERKGFMLYLDDINILNKLSDSDFRAVIKALTSFTKNEEREPLSEAAEIAFSFMAGKIGRDFEQYEKRCSTNRTNVMKRYELKESESESTNVDDSIQSHTNVYERKKSLPNGVNVNVTVNESNSSGSGSTRARDEAQPEALSAVQYVSTNVVGMTAGNWEDLQTMMQDGLPDELIIHGVDEAGAQGVHTWAYLRKILNRYLTSGITTVEQAKAEEAHRTAATQAKARGHPRANAQSGSGNIFADLVSRGDLDDL